MVNTLYTYVQFKIIDSINFLSPSSHILSMTFKSLAKTKVQVLIHLIYREFGGYKYVTLLFLVIFKSLYYVNLEFYTRYSIRENNLL